MSDEVKKRERVLEHVAVAVRDIDPFATVYLYGSRAREDNDSESDWDFLVIVPDACDCRKQRIKEALSAIEAETDEILSAVVVSQAQWTTPPDRSMPLFLEVRRDGIPIVSPHSEVEEDFQPTAGELQYWARQRVISAEQALDAAKTLSSDARWESTVHLVADACLNAVQALSILCGVTGCTRSTVRNHVERLARLQAIDTPTANLFSNLFDQHARIDQGHRIECTEKDVQAKLQRVQTLLQEIRSKLQKAPIV